MDLKQSEHQTEEKNEIVPNQTGSVNRAFGKICSGPKPVSGDILQTKSLKS